MASERIILRVQPGQVLASILFIYNWNSESGVSTDCDMSRFDHLRIFVLMKVGNSIQRFLPNRSCVSVFSFFIIREVRVEFHLVLISLLLSIC